MGFRLANLYQTLARAKGQGQGRPYFDCKISWTVTNMENITITIK